ncbi:MAG: hypothetical protein MZV64_71285 [Ignavibacteriales bacterium]|nr:hypothetical protein [Ignavibacteriales bacterium]
MKGKHRASFLALAAACSGPAARLDNGTGTAEAEDPQALLSVPQGG